MSNPDKINATMLKDLLASVKDLRSKVVALKGGATGGIIPPTGTTQGGDEPGQDAQLLHGSGTSDINAPPAKKRKKNGEESDKEAADSSNNENNTFTLSKAGRAFMEAAFKTKLNATARQRKISKLGLPDCKWTKSPELEAFIASSIPKEVVKNDNTEQKIQKLWLEATSPLTAVVECSDSEDISPAEVIQGVRTVLVLLGNASQHHALQRRKMILQHLNPQLKSLVQDANFTDAPSSLFGAKFGEIYKYSCTETLFQSVK